GAGIDAAAHRRSGPGHAGRGGLRRGRAAVGAVHRWGGADGAGDPDGAGVGRLLAGHRRVRRGDDRTLPGGADAGEGGPRARAAGVRGAAVESSSEGPGGVLERLQRFWSASRSPGAARNVLERLQKFWSAYRSSGAPRDVLERFQKYWSASNCSGAPPEVPE